MHAIVFLSDTVHRQRNGSLWVILKGFWPRESASPQQLFLHPVSLPAADMAIRALCNTDM